MTEEQKIAHEFSRVKAMLAEAIQDLEAENGDIRFFNAALVGAAIQLCAEVEGTEGLHRVIAHVARGELVRTGNAGRA